MSNGERPGKNSARGAVYGGEGGIQPGTSFSGEMEVAEPTEMVKIFDSTKNFAEIIKLFVESPKGVLVDASGKEINAMPIVQAKLAFENGSPEGGLVEREIITQITRSQGLREAVVRAMSPNFEHDSTFAEILPKLNLAVRQNKELTGLSDLDGQPLSVIKDSSGNITVQESKDVKVGIAEFYVKLAKNILLAINEQGKNVKVDVADNFVSQFTSNRGLREAINRAIDQAISTFM